MNNLYLAIKDQGQHEIIIDKSRFICSMSRAKTEEEAIQFIQKIKKQHFNATHNCSAYIVYENKMSQKAMDDGEPSGTAGIPMLEVLRKNHLTDTVCVVTRYFGGIKLGAGGLIRAYSSAVSEAIKEIGMIEYKKMQVIDVTLDYAQIGLIDSRFSQYQINNKTYLEKVTYEFLIDEHVTNEFIKELIDQTNNKIHYELKEIMTCEIDYIK